MRTRTCLVLTILVMVIYGLLWPAAPYASPDTLDYLQTTTDLRDGQLNRLPLRPIGYSVFLLIVGSSRLLFYIQLFIYFICILFLANFINHKYQWLFVLIAVLPPFVEPAAHILTETLTLFLLVTGTVSLYQWYQRQQLGLLIIGSSILSLSGLVRPTYQLLLPILALAIYWTLRRWRPFLLMMLISGMIIGAYSLYNFVQFNYFGVSPLLGLSLSTKTARVIDRLPDDYTTEREILIHYRNAHLLAPDNPNMPGIAHTGKWYIWEALPEYQQVTNTSLAEASTQLLKLNLYLIQREPLEYLVEVGTAAVLFWMPASNHANFQSRFLYLLWSITHFLMIGAFFILIYKRHPSDFLSRLMLITIGYTVAVSALIEIGAPRFRQPVDPFILYIVINQLGRKNEPQTID